MGRWAGEETELQGQRDLCQASQRAGEEPGLDLLRQSLGLFVGAGCVCVWGGGWRGHPLQLPKAAPTVLEVSSTPGPQLLAKSPE